MKVTSIPLLAILLAGRGSAQAPSGASTPEALATLVMQKFSSGTPQEFAAIYPDSAGRVFMRDARGTRTTEIAEVVWKTRHRAVLLLGGVVKAATAARGATMGSNETNGARHFSGFYEAVDSNGTWKITHKIPFDSANYIRSQSLHVEVAPATGLRVVDTLGVTVGAEHGFAVRLNNAIQLGDVTIDGRPIAHVFGGGVLWMKAPKKSRASLVLSYSLEASRSGRPADTATTAPAFGAFHNTDVWHPFFDYLSAHDLADISAVVRIPSEYYLTTTVPQTDSVKSGVRTSRRAACLNSCIVTSIVPAFGPESDR